MKKGGRLETLVMAAQAGVVFDQVPNGVKFLRGGRTVGVASPCDFFGTLRGGRSIVFDAKECGRASFDCSTDKLAEHQRLRIIRHGMEGAVAGLLVIATRSERVYWLDWTQLLHREASYPWEAMADVGSAKYAIDWSKVVTAAAQGQVTA